MTVPSIFPSFRAEAGIQNGQKRPWTPVFTGVTAKEEVFEGSRIGGNRMGKRREILTDCTLCYHSCG
ncbi:MAG: hypothetical protein PHS17_05350, partial [Desulfobacterales bacterium]|nr:hypothetical protein [Desulfobacterales bacterium]